jgi:hypothetical protein
MKRSVFRVTGLFGAIGAAFMLTGCASDGSGSARVSYGVGVGYGYGYYDPWYRHDVIVRPPPRPPVRPEHPIHRPPVRPTPLPARPMPRPAPRGRLR